MASPRFSSIRCAAPARWASSRGAPAQYGRFPRAPGPESPRAWGRGPCRAIADEPDEAYSFANKGNLPAVVSNGTAVLGLGDIVPLAGKPVMEGKVVLLWGLRGNRRLRPHEGHPCPGPRGPGLRGGRARERARKLDPRRGDAVKALPWWNPPDGVRRFPHQQTEILRIPRARGPCSSRGRNGSQMRGADGPRRQNGFN
jgi:hypothetical protein